MENHRIKRTPYAQARSQIQRQTSRKKEKKKKNGGSSTLEKKNFISVNLLHFDRLIRRGSRRIYPETSVHDRLSWITRTHVSSTRG